MTELNVECWFVIGALGSDDDSELPPAAVVRLVAMGIIEWREGEPRLTTYGERAYFALEAGDDFPGARMRGAPPMLTNRPSLLARSC
jgi:hypothetical protein